jgi:hypothetical protein
MNHTKGCATKTKKIMPRPENLKFKNLFVFLLDVGTQQKFGGSGQFS